MKNNSLFVSFFHIIFYLLQTIIMMIILFVLFFVIFALIGLKLNIFFNESKLIIYIYGLRVFSLKGEKLEKLIIDVISNQDFQNEDFMNQSNEILKYIDITYLNISMNTIVKSYNRFLIENMVGMIYLNYIYPLINTKIKRLDYCYKENEKNKISIFIKTKINILKVLLIIMKGKIKNGRKTNK